MWGLVRVCSYAACIWGQVKCSAMLHAWGAGEVRWGRGQEGRSVPVGGEGMGMDHWLKTETHRGRRYGRKYGCGYATLFF